MGRPRELTEEERQKLIAEGYRPVEVWVRDVTDEAYKAEARRQAQSAASADVEDRVMEWIEAVSAESWDDL
jgi:Protein  of unknown function (DUF3018)